MTGRCPEHGSDRLGLVLGGERGESLVWWGLVEKVVRRAGPVKGRRRSVTGEEGVQGLWRSAGGPGPQGRLQENPPKAVSSHPEQGFALFSVELLIPWESNPCLLPFQGLDAHREGFYPLHQEGRHHDLPLPVTHLS